MVHIARDGAHDKAPLIWEVYVGRGAGGDRGF